VLGNSSLSVYHSHWQQIWTDLLTLFAIEIPVANISPDDGRSDRFWESLREKAIYEQLFRSVSKYEDVPEALSRVVSSVSSWTTKRRQLRCFTPP
jgi:hypothetical protein